MPASSPAPRSDPSRPTFLQEDAAAVRPATPARSTAGMAWQLPAFGAALTLLVLVVARVSPRPRVDVTPRELLQGMEQHLERGDYEAAINLAALYLKTFEVEDADRARAHFHHGRALRAVALAMDVPSRERLEEAAAQFDQACRLGLRLREREEAFLCGGDCYERLGRGAEAAEAYLRGVALGGDAVPAFRLGLIRLWSRSEPPEADRIAEQVHLLLADYRTDAEDRAAALLAAGEAAVRLGRWQEGEAYLTRIPAEFPATAAVRRTRFLLAQAHHAQGQYALALAAARRFLDEAAGAARTAPPAAESNTADALVAGFIVADALFHLGQDREALAAFEQLAADFPTTDEGHASALRAVRCLVRLDRGAEALERLRTAVDGRGAGSAAAGNPWLKPDEIAIAAEEARRFFLARAEYDRVVALATLLRDLLGQKRHLEMLASAQQLIADEALRLAGAGGPEQAAHAERARLAYTQAGDALLALAEVSREEGVYSELLWSAAQCYQKAGAYRRQVKALEAYAEATFGAAGPEAYRYCQASYELGQGYAALGRTAEAVEVFRRVSRSHPHNPYAYRSRLATAECLISLQDLDGAAAALTAIVDNTEGNYFTPASPIWQRALFLLGETLHRRGRHEEGIRRLTEAVERFPDHLEAQRGRYLLAECRRAVALVHADALKTETRPEVQAEADARRRDELTKAVAQYRKVIEVYETRLAQGQTLDTLDAVQQRNSYFFVGDCYFDLGAYDEAIAAYDRAALKYRDDPRSVSAFVQIAEALRLQSKPGLARVAVEKARWMLDRLPGDDLLKRPAAMSREQWIDWLAWANRLE